MSRSNSTRIRKILDAQTARNIYDFAVITLPVAPGEDDPTILYVATAHITVDGQEYQPTLQKVEKITFNIGTPPDGGALILENNRRLYGSLMLNSTRRLEGATIVVNRGFYTGVSGGGYESDQLMEGAIRDVKLAEGGQSLRCQIISDISKRGSRVGTHLITQRCSKVFSNLNGIYRPNSPCGWLVSMGVDLNNFPLASLTSCDLTADGPNGCKAHRNRHRMGAVVETLPPNFTTGGGIYGTIEDPGGNGGYGLCFIADTPVTLADCVSHIPIQKMKGGKHGTIISCLESGEGVPDTVRTGRAKQVFQRFVDGHFQVVIYDEKEDERIVIGASRGQPWYIGNNQYMATSDLDNSVKLLRLDPKTRKFYKISVLETIWKSGKIAVYNQKIEPWETYLVDRIPVHNAKPWQMDPTWEPIYHANSVVGL